MQIETSWDDGHKLDLNIVDLLRQYGISGTFYIPNNCELSDDDIRDIAKDFEIGGHTVSHPQDIKKLNDHNLRKEIRDNKVWLEEVINRPIYKFCYPKGRYDDRVKKVVRNEGYNYARTTKVNNTVLPNDWWEVKTSAHVFNGRKEYGKSGWLSVAKYKFYEASSRGDRGYFHIWGHSWEIERDNLWDELEELLKMISVIKND